MPNIIGTTINRRYKVIESLERGGMAEVYKVWDDQRAAHLAMKVLRQDIAQDPIFLRRFQREAKILAKLQHPHIVRYYGLEREKLIAFLLMEYVEGYSLQSEILLAESKPLPEKRILEVLEAVCAALHYAHGKSLVHCDLKPGNILIEKSERIVLTDFGISRMMDAATSTMVGIGTPAYMAPELVRGQDPTPQSDIYSLGIVLYEMLTGGERPFTGEKATITGSIANKVRWEQVRLEPVPPSTYNKNISKSMETVVLRCLRKDSRERFASSMDLLAAVRQPAASGVAKKLVLTKSAVKRSAKHKTTGQKAKESIVPIWQRWYLWAGLGALGLALLLTQIPLPAVELPILPTNTLPATAEPTRTPPPILTPTPALGVGSTIVSDKDSMTLVYVPAGEFEMGSEDGDIDEQPIHTVYLDAYWIDQTEVTNEMFADFLNEMGNQKEGGRNWFDSASKYALISKPDDQWQADSGYGDYPVMEVTWYGANAYCEWVGRRLPTEAEWEKAARGTDGRTYPWGEGISCSQANYWVCDEFPTTSPVGHYGDAGASPYGAYDMAGNVREWVEDWYDDEYYQGSPGNNPTGPDSGTYRILRGGSWGISERYSRSANSYFIPGYTHGFIGFRCALSP